MYCPECGKEVVEGKFCSFCGTKLPNADNDEEARKEVIKENETPSSDNYLNEEKTNAVATKQVEAIPSVAQNEIDSNSENFKSTISNDLKPDLSGQSDTNNPEDKETIEGNNNGKVLFKRRTIFLIAIPIIILFVLIALFSGRSNTTKLSDGRISYKVSLYDYMEQYNNYLEINARNDHPGKSDNYYSDFIASSLISLENAKKADQGDGTTSYSWPNLLDTVDHGILVDNETGYVIAATVVMVSTITSDAASDQIALAFMPLNEDYFDLVDKAKNSDELYAYKNNQAVFLTTYNNCYAIRLNAITKKQLKELSNNTPVNNTYVTENSKKDLSQVAEDVFATAKSEFALSNLVFSGNEDGIITVSVVNNHINVELTSGLEYNKGEAGFITKCGIDTTKKVQSDLIYTITIKNENGNVKFDMSSGTEKIMKTATTEAPKNSIDFFDLLEIEKYIKFVGANGYCDAFFEIPDKTSININDIYFVYSESKKNDTCVVFDVIYDNSSLGKLSVMFEDTVINLSEGDIVTIKIYSDAILEEKGIYFKEEERKITVPELGHFINARNDLTEEDIIEIKKIALEHINNHVHIMGDEKLEIEEIYFCTIKPTVVNEQKAKAYVEVICSAGDYPLYNEIILYDIVKNRSEIESFEEKYNSVRKEDKNELINDDYTYEKID